MAKEVLKISTILKMFTEEGLTREEIRVKLDCTKTEITEIFRHEKLKNLKANSKKFLLVDDTEEDYQEDSAVIDNIPVKDAKIVSTKEEPVVTEAVADEPDWAEDSTETVADEAVDETAEEVEDSWEEDKVIDVDSAPTAEELEDDEAWE